MPVQYRLLSVCNQRTSRISAAILAAIVAVCCICGLLVPSLYAQKQAPSPAADLSAAQLSPFAYEDYVTGLQFEQEGNVESASSFFERAWRAHPDSYELGSSLAQMLVRRRRVDSAITVLQTFPDTSADRSLMLANCYRSQNDDAKARLHFRRAADHDPNSMLAYSSLANYYRKSGEGDSALWAFTNLVRLQPENVVVWNEIASLAGRSGDTSLQLRALRASVDQNRSIANLAAILQVAQLHLDAWRLDSAKTWLRVASSLDSGNTTALIGEIDVLLRLDSAAQAISPAKRLLTVSPDDVVARRRLGIVYLQADSVDLADSVFSQLLNSGDQSAVAFFYKGRIHIARRELDSALFYCEQVVRMVDTVAQGWIDLGFVYRELGNTEAEMTTYQRALARVRSEEGGTQLTFLLGAAQERAGRLDESIETFERILKNKPDHAPSLNYLGYTLADRNTRLEYAEQLIGRALLIDGENAAFLDSYGWVLYRMGKFEAALEYLQRAAALSDDPTILDHIGDVFAALGKREEARQWWQKALDEQPDNAAIRTKLAP